MLFLLHLNNRNPGSRSNFKVRTTCSANETIFTLVFANNLYCTAIIDLQIILYAPSQ